MRAAAPRAGPRARRSARCAPRSADGCRPAWVVAARRAGWRAAPCGCSRPGRAPRTAHTRCTVASEHRVQVLLRHRGSRPPGTAAGTWRNRCRPPRRSARRAAAPRRRFAGLSGRGARPRRVASAAIVAAPPGGHWLISASPAATASRVGRAARVAAARALGLRQQGVDVVREAHVLKRIARAWLADPHARGGARVRGEQVQPGRRRRSPRAPFPRRCRTSSCAARGWRPRPSGGR